MSFEKELLERSNSCELCSADGDLIGYEVQPPKSIGADGYAHICHTCHEQINDIDTADPNHWRCLNDSMWSEVPAVKVIAYRMLRHLSSEGWPQELLEMIYMEEDQLQWAKALDHEVKIIHKDSNGNVLQAGDTVTLIQDLNVKGAGFTAKRGTAVRRISLVSDNADHIEGKVDGQHIVILTKYVKKSK